MGKIRFEKNYSNLISDHKLGNGSSPKINKSSELNKDAIN